MNKGVVETYNGGIAALRRDGYSLQSIGDTIGVTRERVRQILNEYYGGTKVPLLNEAQAAKICGCSSAMIRKLRKQGKISPKIRGSRVYYYDRDNIEKAYLALQKNCTMCGKPIKQRHKYCEKCGIERQRYIYPFLSPDNKKKHLRACSKWQREHPERYKIIQAKATRNYLEKQRKLKNENFGNQ